MKDKFITISNLKLFWAIITTSVLITATITYHYNEINNKLSVLENNFNTIIKQHQDFYLTFEGLKNKTEANKDDIAKINIILERHSEFRNLK